METISRHSPFTDIEPSLTEECQYFLKFQPAVYSRFAVWDCGAYSI